MSAPPQNFAQQYQAFLQAPDLFEQQVAPLYKPFLTSTSLPLSPAILEYWQEAIAPRLVLGKRVEYFLQYYLQQQEELETLTHNLQIIKEKQTIGELDFLYYNKKEQQGYHLEQVYKFYIYYPTSLTDLDNWIGPNNKDTLVQKLDKLQTRQFPLLNHPATQTILTQKGIDTTHMLPQLSFKAALFTPWKMNFPVASSLNPACWRGYWVTWKDFLKQDWTKAQFFIPEKRDWGGTPSTALHWLDGATAVPLVESWLARQKAPLCWIKTAQGDYLQIFVVWW